MEVDKNLLIDSSDKIVSHSRDLFAYLNEPYEKSANILVQGFLDKNYLDENDVDAVAVNLLARKWVRKIKRAKSIMGKANNQFNMLIDRCSEADVEKIKVSKPSDEWMDYFFDISSAVDNEAVQEIWAHLLLKEHLKPGEVSKVMLNRLALLDSDTAQAFSKLCTLVYELSLDDEIRKIPLVIYENDIRESYFSNDKYKKLVDDYLEYCPNDDELELLSEVGLITMNLKDREYYIYFSENIDAEFSCKTTKKIIKGKYDKEDDVYQITTGYAFFTQVGLSLYNIIRDSQGEYENLGSILSVFVDSQTEM